jgi:nucleotide-binding universal stress UspA family protein
VTETAARYRLVVPTRPKLPAGVLEKAIETAAADGARVDVAIPFVLPATLPIAAAPPRLVARVEEQERLARQALRTTGALGSVEVFACRGEKSLILKLCSRIQPAEIVLAGPASWSLKRALHGRAPVVVVSGPSRLYRLRAAADSPVLES